MLLAAPAASADVAASVSATVYSGQLHVFYTGRDAGLWDLAYAPPGGWGTPVEIPGSVGAMAAGPAADQRPDGSALDLDVFYGRANGNGTIGLGQRAYKSPAGWGALPASENLGGTLTSAPAVAVYPGPALEVFYAGPGNTSGANQLVQRDWASGSGWSGEISLGGELTSAPSVDVFGSQINVFARGGDDGLYEKTWTPTAGWGAFPEIPGTNGELRSAPRAVVEPSGSAIDVLYVGTNDGLWDVRYTSATGWAAPIPLPGTAGRVGSAPAAVSYQGSIDAFYLSSDAGLMQVSSRDGVTWTGPVVPAPTPSAPAPAPVTTPAPVAAPPVSTTTIKPTGKHNRRPRVKAALKVKWKWSARGTRVAHVKTVKFPPKARITIRCSGRRCPLAMSAGWRDLGRLWHRLEHHWFHRRDEVVFKITQRGRAPERAVFRIRRQASPVLKQS